MNLHPETNPPTKPESKTDPNSSNVRPDASERPNAPIPPKPLTTPPAATEDDRSRMKTTGR